MTLLKLLWEWWRCRQLETDERAGSTRRPTVRELVNTIRGIA